MLLIQRQHAFYHHFLSIRYQSSIPNNITSATLRHGLGKSDVSSLYNILCHNAKSTHKHPRIKLYKMVGNFIQTTLLYCSESSVMRKKDVIHIQTIETKFIKSINGCNRTNRIQNIQVRADFNIFPIHERINWQRQNWKGNLYRMA